jgi:hypothetical protein
MNTDEGDVAGHQQWLAVAGIALTTFEVLDSVWWTLSAVIA